MTQSPGVLFERLLEIMGRCVEIKAQRRDILPA
jgi:hypothetical protein